MCVHSGLHLFIISALDHDKHGKQTTWSIVAGTKNGLGIHPRSLNFGTSVTNDNADNSGRGIFQMFHISESIDARRLEFGM